VVLPLVGMQHDTSHGSVLAPYMVGAILFPASVAAVLPRLNGSEPREVTIASGSAVTF